MEGSCRACCLSLGCCQTHLVICSQYPRALSPGNTWTCFKSSVPGKFPGNASLSTGTASVLGDPVPNSVKRHQEVGAGEPGSSSCPGHYQTPCPHSCSAPPQHTRVGLGQTLRRMLTGVEPSCLRDLRDHLRPPVVQRCPTEKQDKPGSPSQLPKPDPEARSPDSLAICFGAQHRMSPKGN